MSIGERIRVIRKDNCLTLDKFGERIGFGKGAVSMMESGKSNVTNQTILSICREFGIREAWLRDGDGPMREPEPSGDDLDACLDKWGLPHEFRGLFLAYRNLQSDAEREAVRQFIRDAAMEIATAETATARPEPSDEQLEREAREEAEEYYRLQLEEKRQIEADIRARGLDGTVESSASYGRGGAA